MKMNHHYGELKASYLFVDIAHKVAAYQEAHPEKEIIRLGIGDVTQPLAKCVVTAMQDAAAEMGTKEGFHGYGPEQGYPFLKQAIQGYYAGRGTRLDEDEIFISDGAKSDLANVLGLFDVDNTVLVPDPVYPTYVDDNVTDGRRIIYGRTSQENGFLGMPDENVKADIIYICSPNNPTGAVYTRENLEALAMVLSQANGAREQPIFLISDEPYREVVYGAEVPWVPSIYEHTVVCYSYSKSLSLPGERVGWILVPDTMPLADQIMPAVAGAARCLGFVCAPALFQRVVTGCVDEPVDVEAYARNRETLTRALTEYGYTYVEPDGAFYLWVRALEDDAEAFCERARTFELLPVPSNSFGVPGWIRIGYCVSHETIERSLPAWKALADTYK